MKNGIGVKFNKTVMSSSASKGRASLGRFQGPRIVQPVVNKNVSPLFMQQSASSSANNSMDSIDLEATKNNEIIKSHHMIQTPASEMSENRPLLHSVSSMIFDLNQLLFFEPLPKIMESNPDDICSVFNSKCNQCLQVCDFTNDGQQREKMDKKEILEDIFQAVADQQVIQLFGEEEYLSLYQTFRRNVIRTTPPPPDTWFAPVSIDFTIDRIEERGWSHLILFYDIIIAFISNRKFNPAICQQELQKLLKGVISMFQSPDTRERDKIMKLFHGMYRTMKKLRNSCRIQISAFLTASMHSPHPRLGISEILNAFVPIIAGFKVPVHSENLLFFDSVLLPLHTSPHVHMFHTALVNTVTTFLTKDERAVSKVYKIILDHWPVTAPTKQILFLNEMELLSSLLKQDDMTVIKKLCRILSICSGSENFTIAERSLMLWESDSFMSIVEKTSKDTFPILIPEIYKTATSHWCVDVRQLALNAMRVLKGLDLASFEKYGASFKKVESEKIMIGISKGKFWNSLIEQNIADANLKESKRNILRHIFIGCEALNKTIDTTMSPRSEHKRLMSPKPNQTILKSIISSQKVGNPKLKGKK